jgi:hypothetical protein
MRIAVVRVRLPTKPYHAALVPSLWIGITTGPSPRQQQQVASLSSAHLILILASIIHFEKQGLLLEVLSQFQIQIYVVNLPSEFQLKGLEGMLTL